MKKSWIVLLLSCVLLSGCAAEQTVERVCDEILLPALAPMAELRLTLPEDASQSVLTDDAGGKLYLCDDYTLTIRTMEAGDLDKTLKELCGYPEDALTVMKTESGGLKRCDWVWSSAGEQAHQIGRGAILDDGHYHYCVTTMADEAVSGRLDGQWDTIFNSMGLG